MSFVLGCKVVHLSILLTTAYYKDVTIFAIANVVVLSNKTLLLLNECLVVDIFSVNCASFVLLGGDIRHIASCAII